MRSARIIRPLNFTLWRTPGPHCSPSPVRPERSPHMRRDGGRRDRVARAGVVPRIVSLAVICAVGILSTSAGVEAQAQKAVRVGVLRPAPDGPEFRQLFEPFRQALRERGFLEGTNLFIELRVRPGTADEMRTRARELVRLNMDAILAVSPAAVTAAAQATNSIPIVAIDLVHHILDEQREDGLRSVPAPSVRRGSS